MSLAPSIDSAPIIQWIVDPAQRGLSADELIPALAARVTAAGVPILRLGTSIPTMHPEVYVRNITWHRDRGNTVYVRPHGLRDTAFYKDSPVAEIHRGGGRIRCRLVGPDADLRYPVCHDILAVGGTDYVVCPLEARAAGGGRSWFSFATDRDGGFRDADLALIDALLPFLSLRFELESRDFATRALLEVYLGKNAAARVLSGQFKRGAGETLPAAIWFCDLRDFTRLSDSRPAAEVVGTLDRYFESVAQPIGDAGGEILKFIGDAVLAIFPIGADPAAACGQALAAAEGALANIATLNREHPDQPPLAIGIALHVGEVFYGNIGGRERLDFTVIGSAVNEATRVESLCKQLAASVLCSAEFARALPTVAWTPRGEHRLRGVAAEKPLFSPPAK